MVFQPNSEISGLLGVSKLLFVMILAAAVIKSFKKTEKLLSCLSFSSKSFSTISAV